MTEVLTESFCERCGTRYTFETAQQRARPLRRITTLGRGLRHFVVQGDASFDEAMAVARSEQEQRATTAQLEAFHRTFNFCLSCRQYTCRECWNAVEGRCLSCAPMPVEETLAPAAVMEASTPLAVASPAPAPVVAVTEIDLPPSEAAQPEVTAAAEPEPEVELEIEPEIEPELSVAPPPDVAVVEPEAKPEPEPVPAEREQLPLAEVAPEPLADVAREPEPEPLAEVVPEPAPEATPELTPELEGAPAPFAEPVASFPGFQPGRSLDDEIAAYEIRIAALNEIPLDPGPVVAAPEAPRVAASAQRVESRQHVMGIADGPREAVAPPVDVTAPGSVAPGTCRSCGLSISASARFCRRCGTRQAA